MTYMPVQRRCQRHHNQAATIDQNRRYNPQHLKQYAGKRESNRVTTEQDQAKHAIDAPLQFVWNQSESVAELDNAIDGHYR